MSIKLSTNSLTEKMIKNFIKVFEPAKNQLKKKRASSRWLFYFFPTVSRLMSKISIRMDAGRKRTN